MNWKRDLEALIESTMALAKDVERQPIPDAPVAVVAAEQALADTLKRIDPPSTLPPVILPRSERDEIRQRVNNFRAHQGKMARDREDYYLQVKARMMSPDSRKNPPA
jgi:hypothetical protein